MEAMTPQKRAHQEQDSAGRNDRRSGKRSKTERAAQAATDSNSDSSYVSAAAAVFSDSDIDSDTARSDVDSDSAMSTSSEDPSSDSSSSGEESEDEDSEMTNNGTPAGDERINLRPGSKPNITKGKARSELLGKLKSFLPDLEAANKDLEREREEGTLGDRNMENFDGEGPHIEMVRSIWNLRPGNTDLRLQDLGLGVLENRQLGKDSDHDSDDSEDGDQGHDILGKLLGVQQKYRKAAHIQEVGNG